MSEQQKEVGGGTRGLKVRNTGKGQQVEGYAIVTAPAISEDLGGWKERISKQALRDAITPSIDIALLWSHDPSQPLARTTSSTMRVEVRDKGLWFSASLPDSPRGEDVAETIRRRDTNACSFGFIALNDSWQREGGILVRTVEAMEVIELTLCLWTAYPDTTVAVRSAQRSGIAIEAPGPDKKIVNGKVEFCSVEGCACRCHTFDADIDADSDDNMETDSRSVLIDVLTRRLHS
jgi:HK97 family phage prohead protease